jgi:hypothetical protein
MCRMEVAFLFGRWVENGIDSESSKGTGLDVFVRSIETSSCAVGDLLIFFTQNCTTAYA